MEPKHAAHPHWVEGSRCSWPCSQPMQDPRVCSDPTSRLSPEPWGCSQFSRRQLLSLTPRCARENFLALPLYFPSCCLSHTVPRQLSLHLLPSLPPPSVPGGESRRAWGEGSWAAADGGCSIPSVLRTGLGVVLGRIWPAGTRRCGEHIRKFTPWLHTG